MPVSLFFKVNKVVFYFISEKKIYASDLDSLALIEETRLQSVCSWDPNLASGLKDTQRLPRPQ